MMTNRFQRLFTLYMKNELFTTSSFSQANEFYSDYNKKQTLKIIP